MSGKCAGRKASPRTAHAGGVSPRIADTMLSTRRVSRTWRARNTRTPSHAATAVLPSSSSAEFDSETRTGHPVPTSSPSRRAVSGASHAPGSMRIRSSSTPAATARGATATEHTTPAPNSAATSTSPVSQPPPLSRSRPAPAAHAERPTSGLPVSTLMTRSG
jgi:hypothetical protein